MSYSGTSATYRSLENTTTYHPHVSALEVIVQEAPPIQQETRIQYQTKKSDYETEHQTAREYHNHTPTLFLSPFRSPSRFIEKAKEIEHYVQEMVEKTTQKSFPKNLHIQVLDNQKFVELHAHYGAKRSNGVVGFSVNRNHEGGISTIVVRKGHLDEMLLTVAHEIGHVIAHALKNPVSEEAKAFAFELACSKTIAEYNIAGLGNSIDHGALLAPAKNGLHDRAFAWLREQMMEGKKALEIFLTLINSGGLVVNVH